MTFCMGKGVATQARYAHNTSPHLLLSIHLDLSLTFDVKTERKTTNQSIEISQIDLVYK